MTRSTRLLRFDRTNKHHAPALVTKHGFTTGKYRKSFRHEVTFHRKDLSMGHDVITGGLCDSR